MKLGKMFGLQYINGYDHPEYAYNICFSIFFNFLIFSIVAGQGTMALEMIEQVPNLDAIIVPTGGAGLLAGVAIAAKAMNPKIKIIVKLCL